MIDPSTNVAISTASTRVGVDLASVSAVASSVERFGDRYLRRLFTNHEIASCTGTSDRVAASLAARFAAKEATIKVLRPGDVQADWRSIEIRRNSDGSCEIELHGAAKELAAKAKVTEMAVSLSHEGGIAAAVVIATCGGEQGSQHRTKELMPNDR